LAMPRTRKAGPSGSLGPRYGTSVRKRYAAILREGKGRKACPICTYAKVRRLSVGIWACRKCGHIFAGGAYSPSTKLGRMAKRSTLAPSSREGLESEATGPIRPVSELVADLGAPKRGARS